MVWPRRQDTSGKTPKQTLLAKANRKRPKTKKKSNFIQDLGWNRLEFHPSEMMDVTEDREMWRLNLELLPQTSRKSGQ